MEIIESTRKNCCSIIVCMSNKNLLKRRYIGIVHGNPNIMKTLVKKVTQVHN